MPTNKESRRGTSTFTNKIPVYVDRVNIKGLQRTYDDYVQRVAENLFKVTTLEELTREAINTQSRLRQLGIFRNINVHIDTSRGKLASTHGYDITFSGKELPRIKGEVSTEIGQNEGGLRSGLTLPNIFGRGESLAINGAYSSTRSHDFNVQFRKPFLHTRYWQNRPEFLCSLFRNIIMYDVSSFQTCNTGALAEFSFKTLYPLEISHSLQYETAIRHLSLTRKSAPFKVREHCGPKLASLLRYICLYDGRDNPVFSTKGIMLKSISEYSGLNGNIHYWSTTAHAEVSAPVTRNFAVQLCARMGVIKGTKRTIKLPINNLFYCGGPLTLRGFEYAGAGPIENNTALGAETFWAVGGHIWSRLPFVRPSNSIGDNIRVHLFYNLGNCNNFTRENMRSAYGIGLALNISNRARIEFNYCFPHFTTETDRTKSGFQFGVGLEFV